MNLKVVACKDCHYFTATPLWNACGHEKATYKLQMPALDKRTESQHTCEHLRLTDCGRGASLFAPK